MSRRFASRHVVVGWIIAMGVIVSGCAGYRLGPTNGTAAGSQSVQVDLFPSEVLVPRASEAVNFALRRQLQQEGTYRLSTDGSADIVVTGTLVHLERFPYSFKTTDTRTPRDYIEKLTAHVKAVERASGKVLLDRPVTGETVLHIGANQTDSEREALPLLAENLARNITSLLVDGTW
jgi:hypothetical protein